MTNRERHQGWTHELWRRSRYEKTARWRPDGGMDDPTLASVVIDGDTVTLHFREKVRFHDEFEYQLRRLTPG